MRREVGAARVDSQSARRRARRSAGCPAACALMRRILGVVMNKVSGIASFTHDAMRISVHTQAPAPNDRTYDRTSQCIASYTHLCIERHTHNSRVFLLIRTPRTHQIKNTHPNSRNCDFCTQKHGTFQFVAIRTPVTHTIEYARH